MYAGLWVYTIHRPTGIYIQHSGKGNIKNVFLYCLKISLWIYFYYFNMIRVQLTAFHTHFLEAICTEYLLLINLTVFSIVYKNFIQLTGFFWLDSYFSILCLIYSSYKMFEINLCTKLRKCMRLEVFSIQLWVL